MYTNGDDCKVPSGEIKKYSSRVDFECYIPDNDLDAPEEKPILDQFDLTSCFYHFKWKTKYACGQCR